MKIGIMSMQRIINYGSWLQAYGLKQVLCSMGHKVEFVDYLAEPPLVKGETEAASAPDSGLGRLLRMLSPAYRRYRSGQIRMNQSFSAFYRNFSGEFLPMLGVSEDQNLCPELDALVIGSDEVFNCTQSSEAVGYSLQLFGRENRAKRLLSYAASFGSTTLERLEQFGVREEIGQHLAHFDAISVRDENSAGIVRELCGIEPDQNIDPVLLYEFQEVDDIPVPQKDYIVVYAYAGRIHDDEAEEIRAFAKKYNKKIITLGFYQPFCDEYALVSPLEVLAYVKHADYVISDTFHGTVFSIRYQKKFAALIRQSNRQKLADLLHRFDLDAHAVSSLSELEEILLSEIPEEHIRNKLVLYRRDGHRYLRAALEHDCK